MIEGEVFILREMGFCLAAVLTSSKSNLGCGSEGSGEVVVVTVLVARLGGYVMKRGMVVLNRVGKCDSREFPIPIMGGSRGKRGGSPPTFSPKNLSFLM